MENIFFYDTEIGTVMMGDNGTALTKLCYVHARTVGKDQIINETGLIKEAHRQLVEYFEGKRKKFELPLAPKGTDFQLKVWNALMEIPYGETRTYKEIAERVGNPKACRAVGSCNNRNPISIIIPCHRVVGSNGKLVGYAGGLDIKQHLLKLEKQNSLQD